MYVSIKDKHNLTNLPTHKQWYFSSLCWAHYYSQCSMKRLSEPVKSVTCRFTFTSNNLHETFWVAVYKTGVWMHCFFSNCVQVLRQQSSSEPHHASQFGWLVHRVPFPWDTALCILAEIVNLHCCGTMFAKLLANKCGFLRGVLPLKPFMFCVSL